MDSDEDYRDESEFYYPNAVEICENVEFAEETINYDEETMSDIEDFIFGQRPENTLKKTRYDMNVWRRYFESVNETRNIEDIPAELLNVLICRFFMHVKKKNGSAYEPTSLTSLHRSLQRFLNDKNSLINLLKDHEFAKSRQVLTAKRKEVVVQNAKGNRPQAAREITDDEEDQLFLLGEFGKSNPEVLQRNVWWLLSLHFGFRARDESRRLKWGDVELCKDQANGNESLVWQAERGSKTRNGNGQQRAFNPVAQATENERCPVKFYKEFMKRRPDEMKTPESPFFLAINHKRKPSSPIWYSRCPLGKNEIGKFLSKAGKNASLQGNITNHSVRKTCISRLMDADIPSNYVAQLSGHKNLKSLDSYKTASVIHQRKISHVLSRSSQSTQQNNETASLSISDAASSTTIKHRVMSSEASADGLPQASGLFSGASIGKLEGCTFNIQYSQSDLQSEPKTSKRRRIFISDDSDSD